MLTPSFELSQNADSLIVTVRVPYAKVAETDVFFENFDFRFFCKPYFLRLNLPGKVLYQEDPRVKYDVDSGTFTISMPKAEPGEHFNGLDFLTNLLAPKTSRLVSTPKIEVLGEVQDQDFEEFDWEIEQSLEVDNETVLLDAAKCGFANKYSCSVFKLKEETLEIFDVMEPHGKSAAVRSKEKFASETQHFSEDYYLSDLHENDEIQHVIKYRTEWDELFDLKEASGSEVSNESVHFTSEEKERMRKLLNKEYLLEESDVRCLLLGLIDILFAFAYDKRTTENESTVESAWTINKLSATLSWLEVFPSVKAVAKSSVRRSLIYPLYRHWELSMKVLSDTRKILSLGSKYVLKCLLEIHKLFCNSDPRYILNDLYISDYCVWLQSRSSCRSLLLTLSDALEKVKVTKEDIALELRELEHAAELVLHGSHEPDASNTDSALSSLCSEVNNLKLNTYETS